MSHFKFGSNSDSKGIPRIKDVSELGDDMSLVKLFTSQ